MVDNETFYVTAQDQKKVIGPVTRTQITAALKQGKLKPNHLVSHSQEGPWQTLQEVFASASSQSPSLDKQKKPTKQSQATLEKESKSKSHNQQKPEKEWYTVKDLEPVMRKSGSTIRSKFIVPGKIEAQLIGGRYRIPAKEFRRIEDSVSENPKKATEPTKKEDAQKQSQPVAYYLKRGETIRGPLERAAILQAAKGRMLMTGDQIANSKNGPWQDVTKEQLQQLQQESDKEHVTAPPKDRAELKKWLQANKDESSVSCPHCSASVKHSNLLQHCDKLHFHSTSADSSDKEHVTAPPTSADSSAAGGWLEGLLAIAIVIAVVTAGAWGLWELGGWSWGLATQGWANSGAFRVVAVCVGVAVTIGLAVTLGMAGVVIILELMWTGFCCWGFYVIVAGMEPEGTLQWLRAFAALGFALFFIGGGSLGVAAGFGAGELIYLVGPPMLIGFLSFAIGGIGATFLWLYSG